MESMRKMRPLPESGGSLGERATGALASEGADSGSFGDFVRVGKIA